MWRVLLLCVGIILSLAIVEVGFRFFEAAIVKPLDWSDRPLFYVQHQNSPTLQDYPYLKDKPSHTFRIAVVGDSYSFAPYMQFTDAFPKKLEQLLNMNDSSIKAEVINYGVPAYSANHEVPKVNQALIEGADLVLLQITPNDAELKPYTPVGIKDFSSFGPFKSSESMMYIFKIWHTLHFVMERLHNSKTHIEYKKYFLDLFNNPRNWKMFKNSIKGITTKCKEKNTPLVAVIFPLFGVPLDANYPFSPIHEKVSSLLSTQNTPVLDLFETFKGIPLERIHVIPGEDRHPNESAHRLAAEKIYLWLEQRNLIPEELKIKLRYKDRTGIMGKTRS